MIISNFVKKEYFSVMDFKLFEVCRFLLREKSSFSRIPPVVIFALHVKHISQKRLKSIPSCHFRASPSIDRSYNHSVISASFSVISMFPSPSFARLSICHSRASKEFSQKTIFARKAGIQKELSSLQNAISLCI
jgi:hypothetical protein